MEQTGKMADTVPGGMYGNSGIIAHEAGIDGWKPGDVIPEHYIVFAVSEEESCKYCEALKAELDSYVERGILTYEVKRLTRQERIAFYAEHGLAGRKACVPQFALMDRRSKRQQYIGGREDAMVWLEHMYVRDIADGILKPVQKAVPSGEAIA